MLSLWPPSGISVWRVELEPVVEQALGRAELQDLRAGAAAVGEAVVGEGEPGARREVAAAIFDRARGRRSAARRCRDNPRARRCRSATGSRRGGRGRRCRTCGCRSPTRWAGRRRSRPRARAHKRARRSGGRDARPRPARRWRCRPVPAPDCRPRRGVADRDLGADLGRRGRAVADVDAAEVGAGLPVIVVDRGRGDLQLLVAVAPGDPAAGIELRGRRLRPPRNRRR